jgi:hypothetical protein
MPARRVAAKLQDAGAHDQQVLTRIIIFKEEWDDILPLEAGQSASENSERFHPFCEYARPDKYDAIQATHSSTARQLQSQPTQ